MIRRVLFLALPLMFLCFTAQADDTGGGPIKIEPTQPTPAAEPPVESAPPAFVELQARTIAAGIGARIGEGELLVDGQAHPFSLRGVSLGDFGASQMTALGPVQNLSRIADFEGTYVAFEAGAAAGDGVATLKMRNQHGVVITLSSSVSGMQLTLAGQAIDITLE